MNKVSLYFIGFFVILSLCIAILFLKTRFAPVAYNDTPNPVSISPQTSSSPTPKVVDGNDYWSWKIKTVCLPVQNWERAGFAPITDLKDGTLIYKELTELYLEEQPTAVNDLQGILR